MKEKLKIEVFDKNGKQVTAKEVAKEVETIYYDASGAYQFTIGEDGHLLLVGIYGGYFYAGSGYDYKLTLEGKR